MPHNVESYLAYAPRGVGLLCAVACFTVEENVYGWYVGASGNEYASAFFLLERFYSRHATAFHHTSGDDLYGAWVTDFPPLQQPLEGSPLPEALSHELGRAQNAQHWLVYRNDPGAEPEIAACRAAELPLGTVGVRNARLNQFDRSDAVWTHSTARFDLHVLDYLKDNWPLDFASADRPRTTTLSALEKPWKQK